jgi:hypothetical protein
MLVLIVILSAGAALGWFFVVNGEARRKSLRKWQVMKVDDEEMETRDALALAYFLISAIGCTTVLVFILLLTLTEYIRHR